MKLEQKLGSGRDEDNPSPSTYTPPKTESKGLSIGPLRVHKDKDGYQTYTIG